MILVDTSVWIDFFASKESEPSRRLAEIIREEPSVALCGIVLTEVLQGIREDSDFDKIMRFFESATYYDATRATHVLAARIYRDARRKGLTIRSAADCLIAACAVENGATLLHNDKDFEKIARVSRLKTIPLTSGSRR